MKKYTEFSGRASLMVVGLRMRARGIWKKVEQKVTIQQKVIRYRPLDKVLDGFIMMLSGGRGIVEVNTRVRPDVVLQAAFGRDGCAEQSSVSETLNACTADNVGQMRLALAGITREHSQAYAHDYRKSAQILDIDLSGLGGGRSGEGVQRGYFADGKRKRGRQLGRVLASRYDEVINQRLYAGNRQLHASLAELVLEAETVLALDAFKRAHTLIRVDGGGGETEQVNWLLKRDYLLLVKTQGWKRIQKLAQPVKRWLTDPRDGGRQVAWVPQPFGYVKPTKQLLVRTRKKNGVWAYSMLVCTAPHRVLAQLGHYPLKHVVSDDDLMLAMLYAYDYRGGGAETQFKADKQGLFLAKRTKHAFAAQEMLILLAQLAHNVLIWTRKGLPESSPVLHHLGILRLVRDVFTIPGRVQRDARGRVRAIALNQRCPYAAPLVQAFAPLLAADDVSLILGKF